MGEARPIILRGLIRERPANRPSHLYYQQSFWACYQKSSSAPVHTSWRSKSPHHFKLQVETTVQGWAVGRSTFHHGGNWSAQHNLSDDSCLIWGTADDLGFVKLYYCFVESF